MERSEGFQLPRLADVHCRAIFTYFGASRLHLGIIFAIIGVLIYAFVIRYTRWGYELRLIGANAEAARNAGIRISRHVLVVMVISGGLAGLAGMGRYRVWRIVSCTVFLRGMGIRLLLWRGSRS